MENFSVGILSVFWIFALLNPVFKKYDYGAGYPLIVAFSVVLVALMIAEYWRKRERAIFEKLFLAVFGVTYIISFYYSQTANISLPETMAYLSMIPLYLLFAHQKFRWSKKFLQVVAVGGFLAVVAGFVQYFLMDHLRMVGPFMNVLYHANFWPNAFAMFLLLIWPVYILVLDKKWTSTFIFAFILSGILLSFSRGAFVAMIGQVVLLAIYFLRRIPYKRVLTVGLIAVVLFFGANYLRSMAHITIELEDRVTFENNEALTSGQERVDFWNGAWYLAKEKPWTGWGPWSFRYAYNPIQKTFLGNSDHPHNIFLKFASENGFVNMAAFIGFLLSIFLVVAWRFKEIPRDKQDLVFVLGVAIAGAMAHNLIDYNFNFYASLILLFVYLAIIRSQVVKSDYKNKGATMAAVFLFIVLVAAFFTYQLYPRYTYLDEADRLLHEGEYGQSLENIAKQLELNPLDAQAHYLRAVIYCTEKMEDPCKAEMAQALALNPMNDINYYRDYLRVLSPGTPEWDEHFQKSVDLFHLYFGYVKYNVHFTAYTPQVESAADMAEILMEYDTESDIRLKRTLMLQYASEHRGGKTF